MTSTVHSLRSVCLCLPTHTHIYSTLTQDSSYHAWKKAAVLCSTWFDTKLLSKVAGGTAGSRQHRPCPRGYFTLHHACEPMWAIKHESQNALMCSITLYVLRPPSSQKVPNREVGSVAHRSDYSFPPTGSSFAALGRFFSSTLYSFSILLHVCSDKWQRYYPSACKSTTEPSVSTGPPTDQEPPRVTAEKGTVFQLWFVSY